MSRVRIQQGEPEHVDDVVHQWEFLSSIGVLATFEIQTVLFILTGKIFYE